MRIRTLTLAVPTVLAPMVGLSHSAFRSLLVELGGVGLLFTEMLAAKRLPHDNVDVSPMLVRSNIESPLVYQIFLSDYTQIQGAVSRLEQIGADGVDVNLGCPAPQLKRRGAGGFLVEDLENVRKIIATLRKLTQLPVSAKIRLGRELDKDKLLDLCSILEGEGVDFITVHGRLHGEKFCRSPRWEWIGLVKKHVGIPVVANGGIFSVEEAKTCLERSGADGIMIGRGGIERPWLFREIAEQVYGATFTSTIPDKEELYFRFVELLALRFRPERRLGRLKQFTHYYAQSFTFGHHLASSVQRSNNMEEAIDKAAVFFNKTDKNELSFQGEPQ